ncbi:MAG: 1-deoxy-D-xylulose-5-phosphate synthase [Muribaculum sp.]|nr:1-deoxy-D-xylulose-5-phosphate synthase [Muribaculum sp.]
MDLSKIKSPSDIKGLSMDELTDLSKELRKTLLKKLAIHGGHVGPNLGFLEATVALHYVFDAPADKLVFDVSHQTYVHKMLTGRMQAFTDPDHYNDVSGFTNPKESEFDLFTIGHTSTAVSLAGGLAKARDLAGGKERVVAVVGDGSLSGGEAFEGLDFGATLGSNFIVVVNDNDMSIAENHGGLYADLRLLRNTNGEGVPNYFRSLGYAYRYVKYGNDIRSLVKAFEEVKDYPYPIVVHVNTQKGMGYKYAEADRETFHFSAPFDIPSGQLLNVSESANWADIFYETMTPLIKENPGVAVITAGTPGVIGFDPDRRREAGSQFIDVGIAEQEGVALASGMAKGGARPVFGVMSSFIQRAYDQLSQDVAINRNPMVLAIFGTGIYGLNDATHLGWFDIALVSNIPEWVYLAPTCKEEFQSMLRWAVKQTDYPVAIRQPGGIVWESGKEFKEDYYDLNKFRIFQKGENVAVIAAGSTFKAALDAVGKLYDEGISTTLINPVFLSGIDKDMLENLRKDHDYIITLEDGVLDGGFGEKIARYYGNTGMRVICHGIPKEFLDRYNGKKLATECHLTPDTIAADIRSLLSNPK